MVQTYDNVCTSLSYAWCSSFGLSAHGSLGDLWQVTYTITVARLGLHDFAIVGYPDATEWRVCPPDEAYAAAVANVVKILTPLVYM